MRQQQVNEEVGREFSWKHIQNQTSEIGTPEYILGTLDVLAPNGPTRVRQWLAAMAYNASRIGRRINLRPIGKNQVNYNRMIDATSAQVLVIVVRREEKLH